MCLETCSTCVDRQAKLVAEAPAKKKTRPLKPKLMVSQKASKVPFSTTLHLPALSQLSHVRYQAASGRFRPAVPEPGLPMSAQRKQAISSTAAQLSSYENIIVRRVGKAPGAHVPFVGSRSIQSHDDHSDDATDLACSMQMMLHTPCTPKSAIQWCMMRFEVRHI